MIKNLIIRKGMFFLSILTLILSGFFITPNQVQALTIEKTVTKYHLDIGVQQIWGVFTGEYDTNGKEIIDWDDNIGTGGNMDVDTCIPFPKAISNVKAYQYGSIKFNWGDPNYTSNVGSQNYYKNNYADYASESINVSKASASGKTASFSYSAKMNSKSEYDLAKALRQLKINQIFQLMAGPYSSDPEKDVKKNFPQLYNKLNKGRNGVDPKVRAYMYFTPVIIQYDVKEKVEIPDPDPESIIADLEVPKEAKMNETFNVVDACRVGEKTVLDYAEVYRTVDNGTKELIATWQGNGVKGENTGQIISQSFSEQCTVTYEIKGVTVNGLTDTATKTINIVDGREIKGQAVLELDSPFGYEGHPFDVYDNSTFEVDGESYSAKRAYEEKIARSSYRVSGGTIKKDGLTSAICTIPKKGFYPITLNVTVKNGERLTDNKTKEIRKTPFVIGSLGGTQKQNRKQVLTFKIATYPDKPIVDYDITIKDLKTNEVISLTKDAPQENGECIKTRSVKEKVNNQYWTTLTVEFLTKYPCYDLTGDASQRFSYKIKVTDSKGDSDDAYKEFDVVPDKPPVPFINMQTAFMRAEGTNTAKIEAIDGSLSDGDQLQRTWSIVNHNPLDNKKVGEFVNATGVNGYENLAFGTNQKIGWNKEGVGKTTVKLHVKDQWIEQTLEEYIKPSDYLEAETTAQTEVINIAPVVSIKPLDTYKANIALLIDKNKLEQYESKYNEIQSNLIENGIDGNLSFIPVTTKIEKATDDFGVQVNSYWGTNVTDSKRIYITVYGYDGIDIPVIKAYNSRNLKQEWQIPMKDTSDFNLAADNKEKYLIKVCSNNIDIINSKNGQILATLNSDYHLKGDLKAFTSEDGSRIYLAGENGIQKIDIRSGKVVTIVKENIHKIKLMNGKIGYISGNKTTYKYYLAKLDLESEQIEKIEIPMLDYKNISFVQGQTSISDWSEDGKILFSESANNSCRIWLVDTKNKKQGFAIHSAERGTTVFMCSDKYGNCEYICVGEADKGTSKYYNDVFIYKAECKNTLLDQIAHWDSGKTGGNKIPNMGYYDKKENEIHMLASSFYPKEWIYDVTNNNWDKSGTNRSLNSWTGKIEEHDDLFTNVYHGYDSSSTCQYMLSNGNIDITPDESAKKNIIKRADLDNMDNNYIINTGINDVTETQVFAENKGATVMQLNESLEKLGNQIKKVIDLPKYALHLVGNGASNIAGIYKEIVLEPEKEYEYSYDMQVTSGKAIDVMNITHTTEPETTGKTVYRHVVYRADFTKGNKEELDKGIVQITGGMFMDENARYQRIPGLGQGSYDKRGNGAEPAEFEITMAEDGYASFNTISDAETNLKIDVDGKLVTSKDTEEYDYYHASGTKMVFLNKGKHHVKVYTGNNEERYTVKYMEVGYFKDNKGGFTKQHITGDCAGKITVKGNVQQGNPIAYTVLEESQPLRVLNLWDVQNLGYYSINGWDKGYHSVDDNGHALTGHYTGRISNKGRFNIILNSIFTIPEDKVLIVHKNDKIMAIENDTPYRGKEVNYNVRYTSYPWSRMIFNDFYAIEMPKGLLGYTSSSAISVSKGHVGVESLSFDNKNEIFYIVKHLSDNTAVLQKCITGSGEIKDEISLSTNGADGLLNAYISNFNIKSKSDKMIAENTNFNSIKALELGNWYKKIIGSGIAQIDKTEIGKKDEERPLIYKKGQLIRYGINYSDYEKDPSKSKDGYSYWLYAHTPYNDGEHKDAAIIYDEDGNVKSICGEPISASISIEEALNIAKSKGLKILNKPIERFYVDGKYTVFHWEYDDTSRGLVAGGYPLYDKVSNTAELTFYVEGGGGSVPWITGISTSPDKVKENEYFSINIGIDDAEKDILHLTTEVYKDRKHIFTHRKKNILPIDSTGQISVNGKHADGTSAVGNITYPVTNTGALPQKAQIGTYEVVCTVRDETGAGIGRYKFIVVSEGKIAGEVYHTEQWDINRKKYNINRFKDEINGKISYAEYMKLKVPRARGTNVFWSGEKFMLNADVAGSPEKVTCSINGTNYMTKMKNSGKKNAVGETIYSGSLWEKSMINKWGRKDPVELIFTFTAYYSGGTVKKHEVKVIVDNMDDYWKLHRVF